jgi:hypothetical protein
VALYFENSIQKQDWPLLASAAADVDRVEQAGAKLIVESRRGVSVDWRGPVMVDGRLWPFASDTAVLLARGMHTIEPAAKRPPLRVLKFNGELQSASVTPDSVEFAYHSEARAMAKLDHAIQKLEIDGLQVKPEMAGDVLILPRGQHLVNVN